MGAFTSLSDLVNRLSGGSSGAPEHITFMKSDRIAGATAGGNVAGIPWSLWLRDGMPGAAAAAPGAVAIPDNTTAGALKQTDPSGGRQKYLLGLEPIGSQGGTLILYDRLLHVSGLSGTVITAQAVQAAGLPALTRYTNGQGNFILAEVYTAIGTTPQTITAAYKDQDGNSSTSVATKFGGAASTELSRTGAAAILPLASGDTGVRGVDSVTLSASTGTAGDFGVTVGHVLAAAQVGLPGHGTSRDLVTGFPGLVEVLPGACLAWLFIPISGTNALVYGTAHFAEA